VTTVAAETQQRIFLFQKYLKKNGTIFEKKNIYDKMYSDIL
jgi:hypothetical protein